MSAALCLANAGLNKMLMGFDNHGATALCTFAFCAGPNADPVLFEGTTEGRIVPPRGDSRFGWDPIFEVAGTGKTCVDGETLLTQIC